MKPWRDMTVSEWTRFLERSNLRIVRVQKPGVRRVFIDPNPASAKRVRLVETGIFEVQRASSGEILEACETFFEAADAAHEVAKKRSW